MKRRIGGGQIEVVRGNIVQQQVDAIVNAANSWMLGGGGVDGAIHNAAGPALLAECKLVPVDAQGHRCPTGETRTTGAGRLAARHVIHGVGPVYAAERADEADRQLRAVHVSALAAAADHACASIAFPAISTGAYGFPIARAAAIAIDAVADFQRGARPIAEVRFILFSASDLAVFERALTAIAG
jgi:O-acetyl-ADP-ribose deacetylase (regulator of RNase III)